MSTIRALILLAVLALAVSGCSMSAAKTAAEQGVDKFHTMLDGGQFDQIYSDATVDCKRITTEHDFVALLSAIHEKLGTVRSSKEENWRVNLDTKGTLVVLTYKTGYAQGDAEEQFVFLIDKGTPALQGYHINSNALVAK
jgi:hypothetical protein